MENSETEQNQKTYEYKQPKKKSTAMSPCDCNP